MEYSVLFPGSLAILHVLETCVCAMHKCILLSQNDSLVYDKLATVLFSIATKGNLKVATHVDDVMCRGTKFDSDRRPNVA